MHMRKASRGLVWALHPYAVRGDPRRLLTHPGAAGALITMEREREREDYDTQRACLATVRVFI